MQYHATNRILIIHCIVLFHFIIQDVIMPVSSVITVTHLFPPIVKTIHVTYRVERVPRVTLGGVEIIVKQVRWHIVPLINLNCL